MEIKSFAKTNAQWLVWGGLAFVFLYIIGEGKVFSWEAQQWMVWAALGMVGLIFNMLHTDLMLELSRPKPQPPEKKEEETTDRKKPFDLEVKNDRFRY